MYSQHNPANGPIPTSFHFNPTADYELMGNVNELSRVEVKHDDSFNLDLNLFSQEAIFVQKIRIKNTKTFSITGTIEFMCCDNHRCLPPKEEDFSFTVQPSVSAIKLGSQVSKGENALKTQPVVPETTLNNETAPTTTEMKSENNLQAGASSEALKTRTGGLKGSIWGFILYAFLWGLAGVLTPCVYPMIPMTVSFFMRNEQKQTKGILKGILFGLSIVFIYTLIGLLVSLSIIGSNFGNVLSSHWIPNLLFFLMFFVFALSFLGMFELVLPTSVVNAADKHAEKGGVFGVFFMALTLIVVSFSCTGPIVGKILIEASQGIAARPIAGMFGYSLAFALPFTLFALFPSLLKKLPKSGGWLNSVKVFMAFILLAFSLKFLLAIDTTHHYNILTRELYLSIWIVLAIILGFYLLGKIKFNHDSDLPHVGALRLILVIIVFSFAVYLVPGLTGAPLNSISSLIPPPSRNTVDNPGNNASTMLTSNVCETPKYSDFLQLPHGLQGYFDLQQGLDCAHKLNKPIFLDIKGHTCSNCKEMEATIFSDPRVVDKLRKDFIIIALYVDDATRLPENEWKKSTYDGKIKKSMGALNLDYEISMFKTNTQPLYAILYTNGKTVNTPLEFNLDVNAFLTFLDDGNRKFNQGK